MYDDGNKLDDIKLIIDAQEYFNNQENWLDQFAFSMGDILSTLENEYTIDFKYGYIDIKYKIDELSILSNLNPNMLHQLVNMRNWILSEKQRKQVINAFHFKPYIRKKD